MAPRPSLPGPVECGPLPSFFLALAPLSYRVSSFPLMPSVSFILLLVQLLVLHHSFSPSICPFTIPLPQSPRLRKRAIQRAWRGTTVKAIKTDCSLTVTLRTYTHHTHTLSLYLTNILFTLTVSPFSINPSKLFISHSLSPV